MCFASIERVCPTRKTTTGQIRGGEASLIFWATASEVDILNLDT